MEQITLTGEDIEEFKVHGKIIKNNVKLFYRNSYYDSKYL